MYYLSNIFREACNTNGSGWKQRWSCTKQWEESVSRAIRVPLLLEKPGYRYALDLIVFGCSTKQEPRPSRTTAETNCLLVPVGAIIKIIPIKRHF